MDEKETARLLIVDDIILNLDILSTMLRKNGYTVWEATSGEEALELITTELPDLILLDISMPKMSGYEVCERLKADQRTKDIPVIFISSFSEIQNKVRAFEVGGVDYVTKPFRVQEVVARVQAQLTLYRQRRQIEQLLEKERNYYEQLNKMRDELMHTTTHDLKNPINLILGYASLLQEQESVQQDAIAKEFLHEIQRATNRMLSLVTDLLDLAQIETGIAILPSPVNLPQFLSITVGDYAFQAEKKQVKLAYLAPEGDITINADERRLEQVLGNLLSNAIKYTPSGGSVTVSTMTEPERVVIQIRDTGLGIPQQDVPRLFDKFFRVEEEQHYKEDGTGLGLAIVKAIIEKHNAQIWVESELGKGSTFYVAFSLAS